MAAEPRPAHHLKPAPRGGLDSPLVAVAALGAAMLATIGSFGLTEPTEARYAEIAREMLASGDWIVPRLDGIAHWHKPPLAYWAGAAGMGAFGVDAFGARLPAALAAILTLLAVARIASRAFGALGLRPGAAVWVTGTCALFFALTRALATDPFLAAAVAGFWALAPSPWAIAAIGAGFLAKGPVVLVHTALPVLVAAAWGRARAPLRLVGPGWAWGLAALVALPWYALVAWRTPGLIEWLLGNQLWGRYASTTHGHRGPPWYFVALVIAGTVPWTAAFVAGTWRTWRERERPEARLLLAWLLAPIAFLSFSGSKLPSYLLPSLPAAALLATRGLESRAARRVTALLLGLTALAGLVAVVAAGLGTLPGAPQAPPPQVVAGAIAAVAAMGAGAALLARARVEAAGLAVAVAWTALVVAVAPFEALLGSPRPIVRLLEAHRGPGEPVVEVLRFNAAIPFYLREGVLLLEVPRDEGFESPGRGHDPRLAAGALPGLVDRHGRVWLFGPREHSEALARAGGLRYEGIATWRGSTLAVLSR